jgi:hypothetical protein
MKKVFLCLFFVLTLCVSQISACSLMMNDEEKFIQGTWRASGDIDKTHSWFLEWAFDKGKFKQTGYPPISQEGKYRVVKREDNKLTLELYDQKGTFGTENKQIEIVTDKEKNKLKIDGKEGFTKTQKQ